MRRLIIIISVILLLFPLQVSADEYTDKGCRSYTLDLSDGTWLRIVVGGENYYIWSNQKDIAPQEAYTSVYSVHRPLIMHHYIKIAGKTVTIEFRSSNENVASVDEEGRISILGPGDTVITVSAEDNKVYIPLKVVPIPLEYPAKVSDAINNLGVPDYETKRYIEWPQSDYVDDIFYYRRDDGHGQKVIHWQYNDYPGLILSIDELTKSVKALYNQSWYVAYTDRLSNN